MAKEDDLATWFELLKQATQSVENRYFLLPVAPMDYVYRERVYCYELYHQLRSLWSDWGRGFTLNGEVDKGSHKDFRNTKLSRAAPDFLVHDPGKHEDNLLVVEVKSTVGLQRALQYPRKSGLRYDLRKVVEFITHERAQYVAGLLIWFGRNNDDVVEKSVEYVNKYVKNKEEEKKTELTPKIHVWWHDRANEPAMKLLPQHETNSK